MPWRFPATLDGKKKKSPAGVPNRQAPHLGRGDCLDAALVLVLVVAGDAQQGVGDQALQRQEERRGWADSSLQCWR